MLFRHSFRAFRTRMHDRGFPESPAYVHLPERLLEVVERNINTYNSKCASKKYFYLVYLGLKAMTRLHNMVIPYITGSFMD